MAVPPSRSERTDRRYVDAAIRYARRHSGLTGTNPSVATLIVADTPSGGRIVGRGVTARGGRPHAEAAALSEAKSDAAGATAYVTLEPCAHHGRTPPCAEALVTARVARTVSAASDPDPRVDGRGHAILRKAAISVLPGIGAREAARDLAGYLTRHRRGRPRVTLKLAISADGKIGTRGHGQRKITGAIADRQTHLERARVDAILVGRGTLAEDDPRLDCRLPGLDDRSPARIVLDPHLRSDPDAFVYSGTGASTSVTVFADCDPDKRDILTSRGIGMIACVRDPLHGGVALPEFLEDLGATGMAELLVEGGAAVARSFLRDDLVDRLILVSGAVALGVEGIAAPIVPIEAARRFRPIRSDRFGEDLWLEYERPD